MAIPEDSLNKRIYQPFFDKDIVKSNVIVKNLVGMDISATASVTSIDAIIDDQTTTQSTQIYNLNVSDSTSSYYNSIKWNFYQQSGLANNIQILSGTGSSSSLTASNVKLITIPRETVKDRLVPDSISATMYITTLTDSTSGTYYIKDYPVTSTSGSALFKGNLKIGTSASFTPSASLTSVGEVFYNYGSLVFRGSDVGKSSLSSFVSSTSATFVNGSGTAMGRINIQSFSFRREQQKNKMIFFCRAYNSDFNYSNNPTYRNADGSIRQEVLDLGNVTYISTVGIYDDNNNLLAVAKVSPVQQKTFENEAIFKVAITY